MKEEIEAMLSNFEDILQSLAAQLLNEFEEVTKSKNAKI